MTKRFASLPKRKVIIPSGTKGRPEFIDWLQKNSWDYLKFCVYQTTAICNETLQQKFNNSQQQYVVFTSPSTVEGFLKTLGKPTLKEIHSKLVSIGPTTTRCIQKYNGQVYFQPQKPKIKILLQILQERDMP